MVHALKRLCLCAVAVLVAAGPVHAGFSTVVIDAGHGGHDRGGIPGQRVSEKAMALDVSKRLQTRLRAAGLRTVMTRSGDYFVPLGTRVSVANRQRNAVFVSVHFNSTPYNKHAQGVETYYYGSRSLSLARSVHPRLVRAAGTDDRRIRKRGFYVLRRTKIPAVLVECGFLTNAAEARRAESASHRQKLADAIANGVIASSRR